MKGVIRVATLVVTATLFAACGPSIYSLRRPLKDNATLTTSGGVHTGGGLISCRCHYGDETYVPRKVEYLRQLLRARVPTGKTLYVRLDCLDTIEHRDNRVNRATKIGYKDVPGGDTVHIYVAGDLDGKPFEVKRSFDYSQLPMSFPQMPAYKPKHVVLFKRAFDEIAGEIAAGGSFRP
jgi:hypothetical protein